MEFNKQPRKVIDDSEGGFVVSYNAPKPQPVMQQVVVQQPVYQNTIMQQPRQNAQAYSAQYQNNQAYLTQQQLTYGNDDDDEDPSELPMQQSSGIYILDIEDKNLSSNKKLRSAENYRNGMRDMYAGMKTGKMSSELNIVP